MSIFKSKKNIKVSKHSKKNTMKRYSKKNISRKMRGGNVDPTNAVRFDKVVAARVAQKVAEAKMRDASKTVSTAMARYTNSTGKKTTPDQKKLFESNLGFTDAQKSFEAATALRNKLGQSEIRLPKADFVKAKQASELILKPPKTPQPGVKVKNKY